MRKLRALMGMPVVCGHRRIGRVLRGALTDDLRALDGVWISAGTRGTRYIPAERLEMLGEVAVIAECDGARRRMASDPLFRRAVSTDGRRLGAITGAECDEVSLAVTALEMTAGLWDDIVRGRQRVTRYTVGENGEVIVDSGDAEREEGEHEERIDQGSGDGHADRGIGGDAVRRHELADGAKMEGEGQAVGRLGLRESGRDLQEAVGPSGTAKNV